MAKLTIDFVDVTDDRWEHFVFGQEGSLGFVLPGAYLPEFIESLENTSNPNEMYFFQNYYVLNGKNNTTVGISTKDSPLLQLDAGQRAKLIAYLRTAYAALISVYR